MSEQNEEDIEKTQDGREDEAERIVNANRDIKTAAKESFDELKKFLEESAAEVENMDVKVEDIDVTFQRIVSQMGECERKRQSFAILSCHMSQCDEGPVNFLQQYTDVDQSIYNHTRSSSKGICEPAGGKTNKKHIHEAQKRRMTKNAFFSKTNDTIIRTPMPTPQSSTLDDTVTQRSDMISFRQKTLQTRTGNDHVKKALKVKTTKKALLDDTSIDVNEKKQKKEKKTNERRTNVAHADENKKKWWQFW